MFDIENIQQFYDTMDSRLQKIRLVLQKPLTLTEKILYSHLGDNTLKKEFKRGSNSLFCKTFIWELLLVTFSTLCFSYTSYSR